MPFHFTCPYCYKRTLVDESIAGQSGPCAGCGKEIVVPLKTPEKNPDGTYPVDSKYIAAVPDAQNSRLVAWILKGIGMCVLVAVLSSLIIFLFWPIIQNLKQRRDTIACLGNLQQIANALNAYAADYGTYPPPVVYDAAGKPMHSWRVLILGYLGHNALFAQYNFDQPWDSQENILLLTNCPSEYISPAAGATAVSESNYMLITGNRTVFPAAGPLRPGQITDGKAETLLVVEVTNGSHEWTKPIDLDVATLNRKIGASGPNAIGGNHPQGATAVFADGGSAWLPLDLDPILLDAIITPNGGEPIDPADFKYSRRR
jgi:hypothetical protein